jgi:hypothetical protein
MCIGKLDFLELHSSSCTRLLAEEQYIDVRVSFETTLAELRAHRANGIDIDRVIAESWQVEKQIYMLSSASPRRTSPFY